MDRARPTGTNVECVDVSPGEGGNFFFFLNRSALMFSASHVVNLSRSSSHLSEFS